MATRKTTTLPRRRPAATASCLACRATVTAGQNFCSRCGSPIHPADEVVPEYLQVRARNARATLEAEHKFVTVLFADVVGSTELISDLDPEQAGAILDPILQAMVRAIHRHGGVVTRIQGDGIMALFGAPLSHEEHAESACRAALEIRMLPADPRVRTRVGINSGEVALRVIRNAGLVEYDAVGFCVHIAARMEQTAQPASVRITDATRRLLRARFELRSLGSLPIKGAPDGGIVTFELIGESDSRDRGQATVGVDRSPFINRSAELASMQAATAAAAMGRCQVVAISGHAGIGKSRLIREFAIRLEASGWLTLQASAAGEESGASYGPFVRMLGDCLDIDLDDHDVPVTQQISRSLAARPQFVKLQVPVLALLGNSVEDANWASLTSGARRSRIVETVATVVRHTAAGRKLLFVVENLHWLDRASEVLLDHLIRELSEQSVLIVITYRPGYRERWRRSTGYQRITIKPLSKPDCRRLLDAALGTDPSLAAVKTQLVSRTQGVPLFVEEMVKTLSETAVLDGEAGNFWASAATIQLRIPDSVRPVLAARVDRLPSEAKEVLQVAAAIGGEFHLSLLAAACGCSVAQLAPHLDVLQAGDFILARKGKAAERFAFRHVLIQEATYRSLLSTRRQRIHTAIANAMEQQYSQRLKQEAEALARHCLEAKLWDRAITHLEQAARKAVDHAAHPQAIQWIEQALDALHNLPDRNRSTIESEIEMRLLLRESLGSLGQYQQWLANLDAAEALAVELADPARILAIRVARLHLHNVRADIGRAIVVCREAEDMARAQKDSQYIVGAAYFHSQALNWRGEFRAAIACLHDAQPTLQGLPRDARCGMTGTAAVMYHAQLAPSYAWLGDFPKALEHGRIAWRLAEETRREFDRAVASFGYGTTLLMRGTVNQAAAILEKGLAATARAEIPLLFEALAGPLSHALLRKGDMERALLLTEQVLARPEVSAYSRSWTLLYRAYVRMETGRTEATSSVANEALLRARRNGYLALEAMAHWVLCRFWRTVNEPVARQHLATASAMAADLHLAPLEAHCLAEAARLTAAVQPEAAAAAAVAANRRFRQLGMRFRLAFDGNGRDVADGEGAMAAAIATTKGENHVE